MTLAVFLIMVGVVEVVKGWKGWTLSDILTGTRTTPTPSAGSTFDLSTVIPDVGTTGAGGASTGPPLSNGKAVVMYQEADRIANLHLPYVWGGGHRTPPPADGPFDCSGFVSRVLDKAGLLPGHAARDSTSLMTLGKAGRGQHVTIWANPVHAFLDFDGRHIGTGTLGGGGPYWHQHPTAGFVPRHPDGL